MAIDLYQTIRSVSKLLMDEMMIKMKAVTIESNGKFKNLKLINSKYDSNIEMIGYYRSGNYDVDFFGYKNEMRYLKVGEYKIEHPIDILFKKIEIYQNNPSERRSKDYFDIHKILQKLRYVD